MKKTTLLWIIAFVITIASAFYQRITGPTYPIKGIIKISNQTISYKLERSHSSNHPYKIEINAGRSDVKGNIYWKRFKTNDEWQVVTMKNEDGILSGEIPPQPPAGKIEYSVELYFDNGSVLLPKDEPVVLRFQGDVPVYVLIPHILFIFLAMLFSARTGLEYFNTEKNYKNLLYLTLIFLILGGFIFGPMVQYFAFGEWWTGFPFGIDLTDNKTLIALIGWLIALYKMKKQGNYEKWILFASVLMLIVFLIPHSLLGSELDYSKMEK
ncbi:MAG: hypothetical protein ACPL25_01075 [Ignavibacteria bacterium]